MALATDILFGLPGAAPAVMDLPSIARVTKLPESRLVELAKTTSRRARSAPAAWQATITALDALGKAVGTVPRVFGALLGSADSSSDRLNPAMAVHRPAAWGRGPDAQDTWRLQQHP